jgi:DNA-3-methyladenine glycosylase I
VPELDSRALFEKLILDGFQAGLSWITIPRKRDAFRTAFANFDPEKIARFDAKEIAALMDNPGIIRNRAKIEGTVVSARIWLKIEAREGFSNFLWKFLDGQPQQNGFHFRTQIPVQSATSMALSKGLKERGFKFCGPTIVYAFCQATGMVNDHLISCWRHLAT